MFSWRKNIYDIGPVKQKFLAKNCDYFLTHQFKHVFCGTFEHPQYMFWLRNKKIIFCYTLLSGGIYDCKISIEQYDFVILVSLIKYTNIQKKITSTG